MDFRTLYQTFSQQIPTQVYYFYGSESWITNQLTDRLIKTIAAKGISVDKYSASEVDSNQLVSEVCSNSLFSVAKAVVVRDVEKWNKATSDKIFKGLGSYDIGENILILQSTADKIDQRSLAVKFVNAHKGMLFFAKKVYESQVGMYLGWMEEHFQLKLSSVSRALLMEYTGANLFQLHNDFNKLSINLAPNTEISPSHIQQYLGINKQYNVFELQNALAKNDKMKAYKTVDYLNKHQKDFPMVMVVNALYEFFSKVVSVHYAKNKNPSVLTKELGVPPFLVGNYTMAAKHIGIKKGVATLQQLSQMDRQSKGIGGDSTQVQKQLSLLIKKVFE